MNPLESATNSNQPSQSAEVIINLIAPEGHFVVSQLKGIELLSNPFVFTFEVISSEWDRFSAQIGQRLKLTFTQNEQVCRTIGGSVLSVSHARVGDEWRSQIHLTSQLFALHFARDSRVHLDISHQQLCYRLLDSIGFDKSCIEWRASATRQDFSMLIQSDESQYQFFHRLLNEAGLFYWFEHDEHGEKLIIGDDSQQCPYLDREAILRTSSAAPDFNGCFSRLSQFNLHSAEVPSYSEVPCYSQASGDTKTPGDSKNKVTETIQNLYQRWQETALCQPFTLSMNTNVAQLGAGYCCSYIDELFASDDFNPADAIETGIDGDYLIIGIKHSYSRVIGEAGDSTGYKNEALGIPRITPYYPLRLPKAELPLAFSATIESNGAQPYLNELGEQCVRVDADTGSHPHAKASSNLRQLTPYACAGQDEATGWRYPLLNGDKVLISCINNNPQEAFILGYVQNPKQRPPVTAYNPWQNRLVTPSGNELLMDDNDNEPRILLQSLNQNTRFELNARQGEHYAEIMCQQGIFEMKSEKDMSLDIGQHFIEQVGASKQTKAHSDICLFTEKGDIHQQSGGGLYSTAKHTQLKSNNNLNLSVGRDFEVTALSGGISFNGKTLHSQTDSGSHWLQGNNIYIQGQGQGEVLLKNNDGGIQMSEQGDITLFGNCISLNADNLNLNGDVQYNVPGEVSAAPTVPPSNNTMADDMLESLQFERFSLTDEQLIDYELSSDYANEQLTSLAKRLSEATFLALLIPIFGDEIDALTYRQLYLELRAGQVISPKINVIKQTIHGHLAAYDSKAQCILVHYSVIAFAASGSIKGNQQLLTILVEEFGHYIDDILRNTYSKIGGDAEQDEGAKLAYNLAYFDLLEQSTMVYAQAKTEDFNGPLQLENSEIIAGLQEFAPIEEQKQDDRRGDIEFFGAGYGNKKDQRSHGHRSIELVLRDVGFDRAEDLPRIYFGNWLRDYSQVVDPAIVRPSAPLIADAQKRYQEKNNSVNNPPEQDALKFSRSALTKLIGVLASLEFKEDSVNLALKFKDLLMSAEGEKILGVYRPEEHIDNPMPGSIKAFDDWVDNSQIDPDFAKPPTLEQLMISPTNGMKNYIASAVPARRFPTAVEYMTDRLEKAMAAGKTDEGLRYFGEGLHVLEDFFSHSNFIEVSLIKLGYEKVQPWTKKDPANKRYPIVTGRFGATDVLHSIAPKLAKLIPHEMQDYKLILPGERTPTDQMIGIILEDLDQAQQTNHKTGGSQFWGVPDAKLKKQFDEYLQLRDWVNSKKSSPTAQLLFEFKHKAMQALLVAIYYPLYFVINPASYLVDDLQSLSNRFLDDGEEDDLAIKKYGLDIGSNPTHSLLAKDHDTHHFHDLAATLAKKSVKAVGEKMFQFYKKKRYDISPAKLASLYICHPVDSGILDETIKEWANANPDKIKRAESRDEIEHFFEHTQGELIKDYEETVNTINTRLNQITKQFQSLYE